jgi:hypothetical protein
MSNETTNRQHFHFSGERKKRSKEEFLDFISALVAPGTGHCVNDIHIRGDLSGDECVVEWRQVSPDGEWGGGWRFVEDDQEVTTFVQCPDGSYDYLPPEEAEGAKREWLKGHPSWKQGIFINDWYDEIENLRMFIGHHSYEKWAPLEGRESCGDQVGAILQTKKSADEFLEQIDPAVRHLAAAIVVDPIYGWMFAGASPVEGHNPDHSDATHFVGQVKKQGDYELYVFTSPTLGNNAILYTDKNQVVGRYEIDPRDDAQAPGSADMWMHTASQTGSQVTAMQGAGK